jgi:hypothetical protein
VRRRRSKSELIITPNHTRRGIGRGRQPAGQVEGKEWDGGGGKARNTGAPERNLHHHDTEPNTGIPEIAVFCSHPIAACFLEEFTAYTPQQRHLVRITF